MTDALDFDMVPAMSSQTTFDDLIGQDIIDTRDLIEVLKGLDEEYENEAEEIVVLQDILDQIGDEAKYGTALIRDSYFEEYAEQTAFDLGMVDEESSMRFYIDWEKWANDLRMDYTTVDISGITYWYR